MSVIEAVSLVIATGLTLYLLVALLWPEKFQ